MGLVASWEDYLIPFEEWGERYDEMPTKCKEVVDTPLEKLGGPVGIGIHPEWGWFIGASGQGPFVAWREKDLRHLTRREYVERERKVREEDLCPCDHWNARECETCRGACSCHLEQLP